MSRQLASYSLGCDGGCLRLCGWNSMEQDVISVFVD